MGKEMQGLRLPGFTEELCVWVPLGLLCGVLIQVLPFTGSVPLSNAEILGVLTWHGGVEAVVRFYLAISFLASGLRKENREEAEPWGLSISHFPDTSFSKWIGTPVPSQLSFLSTSRTPGFPAVLLPFLRPSYSSAPPSPCSHLSGLPTQCSLALPVLPPRPWGALIPQGGRISGLYAPPLLICSPISSFALILAFL